MEQTKLKALELNAAKARLYGVQMVHDAASGHPGGSMSCMDVLTYLYFAEMHVDPKNPHDPDRDRFVMSKGHCSPAVYPVLALRGFFPVEDRRPYVRPCGNEIRPRRRYVYRLSGPGHLRRCRHGAGR